MKRLYLFSLVVLAGFLLAGCADLVITDAAQRGRGRDWPGEDRIAIPVELVVENQGTNDAGRFKIAAEYYNPDVGTWYLIPLMESLNNLEWYIWMTSLDAGASRTVDGWILIPDQFEGSEVAVRATVDSCASDEFMPDYCRVLESNENNNTFELTVEVSVGG